MYVQVVKTPLYGADGKVMGLQGIFWDITEQRLAEEKIRRVNSLLAQNRKELRARNLEMVDDLKMAREIQLAMLPQQSPASLPQADSPFKFTHRYVPTGSVGGDFFTISALSETEVGVFICDVAGHGVRSALVTAMIRALVEELKFVAMDPGQFLTKLNRDLHAILKQTGMLTTGFYLVADAKTGLMRFANAGHPKPLLVHRGQCRAQPLTSGSGKSQPALGLFEAAAYQSSEANLAPGDLVMLFTDGLYEVEDAKEELYTQALLIESVQRQAQLPAGEFFDALLAEIRQFSADKTFSDDVCLVGMEFQP
jgi:sigma-B regulation protein RsbU (phosphoserine phosphatase)